MRLTKKDKYGLYIDDNCIVPQSNDIITKLGQLEDIEERLIKYKDFGLNSLVALFDKLTDEDIEYVIQRALKRKKNIGKKFVMNNKGESELL